MIVYNVTVNIDADVHDAWLKWMKEKHMPDVMNTGCFIESKIFRILVEEQEGVSYSIQYTSQSMSEYDFYRQNFATALQQDAAKYFGGKFVAFRTLLQAV